jgi:hypothetical protein
MKVDFNTINNPLGLDGWKQVRQRYPKLAEALLSLDIADVDINSEGYLARALETVTQQIRHQQNKRWEVKRTQWRPYDSAKVSSRWGRVPLHFIDHSYKLSYPLRDGSRQTVYVSEPYFLNGPDLQHLGMLVEKGWQVTLTAWRATHFPGHTLHVAVSQPPGSKQHLADDILATYDGKVRDNGY